MRSLLTISDGVTEVLRASNNVNDYDANLLVSLPGWEDYTGSTIETSQKLIGAGSYITSMTVSEKLFSCTIHFMVLPRAAHALLMQKYLAFTPLTFKREYFNNSGVLIRTETLTGYIEGIGNYDERGMHAEITFDVKCPNPTITIVNA